MSFEALFLILRRFAQIASSSTSKKDRANARPRSLMTIPTPKASSTTNLKTSETKYAENDMPPCVTDVVTGFYYLSSLHLRPRHLLHVPSEKLTAARHNYRARRGQRQNQSPRRQLPDNSSLSRSNVGHARREEAGSGPGSPTMRPACQYRCVVTTWGTLLFRYCSGWSAIRAAL